MEKQPSNPKPGFYKVAALAFLLVAVELIWLAVTRHVWVFWLLGIMSIINAIMCVLKSLVPRETKN